MEKPIFLCNSDTHHLFASFVGALENLASQRKVKLRNLFFDIETTIEIELGRILEKNTHRHNRQERASFDISQDDCDNEIRASTQCLQIQKKSINWSSRISGVKLQCFNCFWFQQCKKWSQLNQVLFATHSC